MAPMVSVVKEKKNKLNHLNKNLIKEKKRLIQIRDYIEKNFEYVGKNFTQKVREIYYDKNNKTIYGTTTAKERKELKEEGIDLLSIPWVSKDN